MQMTSRQSCEGAVAVGAELAGGVDVLSPAVGVGVAVGFDGVAVAVVPDAVAAAAA
jgi:hypothetical protein